jgi:hypothetical protein
MLTFLPRLLITTCVYAVILLSWLIAFPLELVASLALHLVRRSSFERHEVCGYLFRSVSMMVTLFWSYSETREDHKTPPKPCIYMSNHRSNVDPWFLARALWPQNACYVAKGSLANIPLAGWCMKLAGVLPPSLVFHCFPIWFILKYFFVPPRLCFPLNPFSSF